MSKEKEEMSDWKFNGIEGEWEGFDRRMMRYMRKKLDAVGVKLWLGEVGPVFEMDQAGYDSHCGEVMRAIYCNDPSETRKLKNDVNDEFEEPDWQDEWIGRQYTLMRDYIESHCKGQAELELINYSGDLRDLRKHLYKQFGSGSGGNIHEQELEYDRGLPDKGKVAFPAGCDMGEKLRLLESKKLFFMKMAGSAVNRTTYIYCQETKLVRIVLEHVNKDEYGDVIKRVLEIVKFKRIIAKVANGESSDDEFGIPDNQSRSFSDDWLPSWKLLKAALLDEWTTRCNERKPKEKKSKGDIASCNGWGQRSDLLWLWQNWSQERRSYLQGWQERRTPECPTRL
jgi:hypothetical protein